MNFKIIAAIEKNNGIGFANKLPWSLPNELKHFQQTTKHVADINKRNAVIMGRLTWESINKRPLNNRLNVIISKSNIGLLPNNVLQFVELTYALDSLKQMNDIENVFVIGGEQLYKLAVNHSNCDSMIITHIKKSFKCDKFFPQIDGNKFIIDSVSNIQQENDIKYEIVKYKRIDKHHPENQYLDLIRNILNNGIKKDDRTGVGTLSIFGQSIRFDLERFPILTTKQIYWKGVIEELLFFLRGSTNNKELIKKNVHIWDGNSSKEVLEKLGLHYKAGANIGKPYEDGDCGPIYSFQLKHYGADYEGCNADYTNKGIDQIKYCLNLLKTDKNSRRIVLNMWNICQLNEMCLPPCHILYVFSVYNDKLSCMMTMRSNDIGLGLGFNISSCALLTHIFAKLSGLGVGELVINTGDTHIYNNHIEPLKKQIERIPRPFPLLDIIDRGQRIPEDFIYEDFVLKGYYPHDIIKMDMAV